MNARANEPPRALPALLATAPNAFSFRWNSSNHFRRSGRLPSRLRIGSQPTCRCSLRLKTGVLSPSRVSDGDASTTPSLSGHLKRPPVPLSFRGNDGQASVRSLENSTGLRLKTHPRTFVFCGLQVEPAPALNGLLNCDLYF